jgi:hypothetical protein
VLAATALLGWGLGQLIAVPMHVVALLAAFISGAIMMNSMIAELPSAKEGGLSRSCWGALSLD